MLSHANTLLLPLLAGSLFMAQGIDESAVRDLDVVVERLNGGTGVNGVRLRIERATGPAVAALADRMIQAWERESGKNAVLLQAQAGWMIASRLHQGASHVIQWRSAGHESELIWSAADPHPPSAAPRMRAPLPAGCRVSVPVHGETGGMRFIQVSATCAQSPASSLAAMADALRSRGWKLVREKPPTLHAVFGQAQVQVLAMPSLPGVAANPGHRSTLVMVETRPAGTR